jgi:hypothetical protein
MNAPTQRLALLLAAALSSLVLQASCARSVEDIPYEPRMFAPELAARDFCIQTECPLPFATCPGERGVCTVDLRSDIDHCGACDTACPRPSSKQHGSYVCSEGQCRLACAPLFADCNGLEVDGCEKSTQSDPANCGGCGIKCEEGVLCWKGACGCPNGFTQCGSDCKKLDSDDNNCSACGMKCGPPASDTDPRWICGPAITPPNTKWTCASSSCDLQCKPAFGDCNKNFCGDGCEIDLRKDPKNCGACGNACAEGQSCENGACMCPQGTESCFGVCVSLASDVENCGACAITCPGPSKSTSGGGPACVGGKCTYVCFPGFADCDGKISNGCEANLATDQGHCGSCTTECDIANGQPCVGGKCLTKACVDPVLR